MRCHTSNDTRNGLDENKINCIPYGGKPVKLLNGYPSNLPDINPIEHVFPYWDKKVTQRDPQNIDEFINIVKQEWDAIPINIVRNCIERLSKAMKMNINSYYFSKIFFAFFRRIVKNNLISFLNMKIVKLIKISVKHA